MVQNLSGWQRKDELVKLYTVLIENTTVMLFRFHCNKYMCFFCGCPFTDSTGLKEHNLLEHSDMKVRSAFRSLLKNARVKLEISEIRCKMCSQEFAKLDPLLDHLRDVHELKTNVDVRSELFAYKLDDEKMVCQECGEEFQFFGTMLKHYHAYHNRSEPYICEICGMGFVGKSNVASHVKNVHHRETNCNCAETNSTCVHKYAMGSLKCSRCPEVLSSPYMKKRHLATVHNVKDCQYVCDQCPVTFENRSKMIAHKRRVHLKQRTFACEICGYRGFNRYNLTLHMVSHNDSRPFECEFCKKTFQRKKTLEIHTRIHTNDKRCVCKECGKAFVQTASLKLHYRVHHPKETNEPIGHYLSRIEK